MEYKKDLFETENIPDYALQPAKPADEFDPSVYDKLFAAMTQQKAPLSEAEQMPAAGPDVELVSAQIPYNEAAYEVVPEAEPVSLQDTGAVQVSAQNTRKRRYRSLCRKTKQYRFQKKNARKCRYRSLCRKTKPYRFRRRR